MLPVQAARAAALYSPANLAPVRYRRNVLVIHDVAALRHPEAYSRPYVEYQRRLLPRLARDASALITVSEFSRGEVIEALGAAPERVTVVPEGVDERFFADPDPRPAAERHGLTGPYALAVGTMSARKNLQALDQAARSLRDRGIELVLAGSDRGYLRGSKPDCVAWATSTRPTCRASTRAPWRSRCRRATRASGSRAWRRWRRGRPLSPLAPARCPRPAAMPPCWWSPVTLPGFADALVAAACDEQDRARLIEAGRRRAAEFSWTRTARLTDALIGEVIGRG